MTYTIHDPSLVYAAIEARLNAQLSHDVGRVETPDGHPGNYPYTPYVVLTPIDDSGAPTSLGDAHETTVYEFQVASWAGTPQGAEWMATKVRTALLGWTPTVAGRSFNPVEKSGGLPTRRDDGVQPPIFQHIDEYSVFTS